MQHRFWVALVAIGGVCIALDSAAAPPVEDFFRHPKLAGAQLSPSGDYLAFRVPGPEDRMVLATLDLRARETARIVAAYADADVRNFYWVNDDRLVYDLIDFQSAGGQQRGAGLYAVNRDGRESRRLVRRQWRVSELTLRDMVESRQLDPSHTLHSLLRDGSADVIVQRHVFDARSDLERIDVMRLDTNTGRGEGLSAGAPDGTRGWLVDDDGRARAVTAVEKDRARVYWRNLASGNWTVLREFDRYRGGADVLVPWYVDDSGSLYVRAGSGNAEQTAALYRFDVTEKKLSGDPIVSIQGYDFRGEFVRDPYARRTLGVRYLSDARGTAWMDEGMKKIQTRIDALLPGTLNEISCTRCVEGRRFLVRAWSDRQPDIYLLYDRTRDKLELVGESRPWIDPRQMARREFTRYDARDGLSIPVHVTRPREGKGPWPTVVLAHGGPWVRGGEWEWDIESQFLASRGYLVVEPEFRGSTGFGFRHFRAGWRQWGLAMQDDLADAASWAVAKGWADRRRICIAGASYGGYATLMGLIKHPETYQCGVNWLGVTDIDLKYSIDWSDTSEDYKDYGMPVLIGDRVKDAEQLVATSPLRQAARIRQPVLLAYGGRDRRVPIEHGRKFRDEARKTNAEIEWVVYPDEGHGFLLTRNLVDFWGRVEAFLQKYLAPAQ